MSSKLPPARARRAVVGAVAAGTVVAGLFAGAVPAGAAPTDGLSRITTPVAFEDGRYVVVLREPGAAGYTGGKPGLARTSATRSAQFDGSSDAVRAYTRHIRETQRKVAGSVGATVAHSYTMALNGFATRLTGRQAADLASDRRVLLVQPDQARELDTWSSPDALGLTGKNGAWTKHGGPAKAGAGVVVGILDTGIWPESKSFAGDRLTSTEKTKWDIHRLGEKTYMDKADGTRFRGVCQLGDGWEADDCNTKLIGARYYKDLFEGSVPEPSEDEFLSPRDGDGHGTHTASTAAGNHGVRARVEGRDFGRVSGMAPAARIASYKVCYNDADPDTGDCFDSMSLAGIDDAVADGVDVINFSISGAQDTIIDAVEIAFEGAAEAGVFVATSAGNSGPAEETVAHASPWLTTVAASTHQLYENTVVLGNGKKLVGASVNDTPVPNTRLVNSVDVPGAGQVAEDAELCLPDSLDPAAVEGKIVVCTRGVNARVEKSAEVARAGGVGMILANPSENSLDADFHSVPSVHVDDEDAAKLWSYMESAGVGAKARFELGNITKNPTPVPQIGGFSSRGPSLANDADILKPDIAAPGVSVLAAVAPPTNSGRKFDLYSGTSMASPHIAGLAGFMLGVNPDWTPMKVKSAMMTTAKSLFDENGKPSKDLFAQGAGLVQPKRFFNPGLFVTSSRRDWLGFITEQGYPVTDPVGNGYAPVKAKDINQPTMATGQVVGEISFTREFLATRKGTWKVSANVPGFDAKHRAKVVADRRGDIIDLKVTFNRTSAPLAQFASGYVTLTGPTTVRIPVALRPVSVKAPASAEGEGTSGSATIDITAGFTGNLDVAVSGLAAAETAADTVAAKDAHFYCVEVDATSKVLRADLDAANDAADLDLYAYKVTDATCETAEYLAGMSATGSADESFTLADPEPGFYVLLVDGYAAAPGETSIDYVLDSYDVNESTTLGDLAVQPDPVPVVAGVETSFDAVWSGLAPGGKYLGVLEYEGALRPTYLRVVTPEPTP